MTRNYWFLTMIVFLAGCQKQVKQEGEVSEALRVTTYKVVAKDKPVELQYSGTVEAYRTVPLTFQVSGIVKEVLVQEGDRVKKGQLLAVVDPTDYENVYRASLAKYQQAQDAYERLKTVHEQGSLPEIKWVEITTNLEQARSSMEIAQNNLNKCRLYAPEDGFIGRRNIEPGQSSVAVSSAPLELVRIEKVYVKIPIPEQEVNRLRVGQQASFTVMAAGNQTFTGTIHSISPVADMLSRTYTAKILVDNPSYLLKPGMVCDVKVPLEPNSKTLQIPYRAVTTDDKGLTYVFVVDTNTQQAIKRYIQVGLYIGSEVEVLAGLQTGDLVVLDGKEKLSDKQKIMY
ncbi:MAG: efflux RND transporter periplasmic adaptor subunit [Bacteroidales bacterium]|nr:efflux RND transporter periplasmic adaptor subunit [Bacteroidales bacterium]HPO65984.1 efflux RND transporter periplasmic adaptor subunit [Bacteroidales bacterium]